MVTNLPANQGDERDTSLILGWEYPLEEEMVTHSSILAWKIRGQRSLVGFCSWGHKKLDTL